MSFYGKVLIFAQMVLSLFFMAFAGAVYSVNNNWKGKFDGVTSQLQQVQNNLQTVQGELETAKRAFDSQLAEETQRANDFQAKNTTLTNRLTQLQQENNTLQQQRNTQTGLAEAKANEARFRQDEANAQLVANRQLQEKLDNATSQVRDLLDQVATQQESLASLTGRYNDLLKQSAYLKRVVAANRLPTDPREIERLELPPPPVEGLVMTVQKDRTNRPKFVLLSIGQDDGLIEGHVLDVVRRPESRWLGQIKIVSVGPNEAVGEVIVAATNGIIQEGDDVTSKL